MTDRATHRAETLERVKAAARRQLAETGAAGLSLRGVAREVGLVSSAVYRYFPSRDELLTALLLDAYNGVADAAEQAEAKVKRADLAGRWLAVGRGTRGWAVEHPQEWALLFGSPVPGYAAPQETVDPATRIPLLLVAIAREAAGPAPLAPLAPLPRPLRADLKEVARLVAPDLGEVGAGWLLMAWSSLVGSISFELFGHLVGSITDHAAWSDVQHREAGRRLGIG